MDSARLDRDALADLIAYVELGLDQKREPRSVLMPFATPLLPRV